MINFRVAMLGPLLLGALACGTPPSERPAAEERPAAAAPTTGTAPPAPAPRPPATPVTSAETTTDERGRFQLRNLTAGGYRVTFGDPGDRGYTQIDGVQVNATYGANLLDLRLDASASGTLGNEYQPNRLPFVIRGNVVNASGAPVANVRVRADRQ